MVRVNKPEYNIIYIYIYTLTFSVPLFTSRLVEANTGEKLSTKHFDIKQETGCLCQLNLMSYVNLPKSQNEFRFDTFLQIASNVSWSVRLRLSQTLADRMNPQFPPPWAPWS